MVKVIKTVFMAYVAMLFTFFGAECTEFSDVFNGINSLSCQKIKKILDTKSMQNTTNMIRHESLQLGIFDSSMAYVCCSDNSSRVILDGTNDIIFCRFTNMIKRGYYIDAMKQLIELQKDTANVVTYVRCLSLSNLIYRPICDILRTNSNVILNKKTICVCKKYNPRKTYDAEVSKLSDTIKSMWDNVDSVILQVNGIEKKQLIETSYDDLFNCISFFGARIDDAIKIVKYIDNNSNDYCYNIDHKEYSAYKTIKQELGL